MKRLKIFLTAAAVAFTALSGTASAKDSSLVVLGDSITSGYGLEGYVSGDNSSARASFANQLAAYYTQYDNFAVDGRTTGELLTALEDEDISAALSGADTVIISIGGNDFLQPMISAIIDAVTENEELSELISGMADGFTPGEVPDEGSFSGFMGENGFDMSFMTDLMKTVIDAAKAVDVPAVISNIDEILSLVSDSAPDAQVVILTVYDPFEGVSGMEIMDVVAREKLSELNKGIIETAAVYGAQVADASAAFKGQAADLTNIGRMDIHPNKDGHALIFSLLKEIVDLPAAEVSAEPSETAPEAPPKGSPDTGAEGIAVFAGIAATAAAAAFLSRRRR